jgi:hypothetical protein
MGWTLSYLPPNEQELVDAFLLSVEKALCIANGFESKCKYVLRVITLTDAVQAGTDIHAAGELARKIQEKLLGETIRLIGSSPEITPADLATL